MTDDTINKPNFKSSLILPSWARERGLSEAEFLNLPIKQHFASTLVANPFLRFCYKCGQAITFRPNKKGNGPRWLKMEYLQPDVEHVCNCTKEQRLEHLNRVNV